MLKKQLIKDWCAQSWNMEVLFGILKEELKKVQNRAARFVLSRKEVGLTFMNNSSGNLSRKGGRIIDLYCYTKV